MLGRLRMSVDDCIKEYLVIGNRIFGRTRIPVLQLYREDDFEEVVREVVKKHCTCHNEDGCNGEEHFRQPDFRQVGHHHDGNQTCKV